MVTIPFFCPDTPELKKNPVFMYYYDRFQKPYPFEPDVIVAIDNVMEQKLKALEKLESQFLDWWQRNNPININDPLQRKATIERLFRPRYRKAVTQYPGLLAEYYGKAARNVEYAEAFELCEYGSKPSKAELKKLFPIEASIPKAKIQGKLQP